MARLAPVAAVALLASSPIVTTRAAGAAPLPPEPGTWWDVTMQMNVRLADGKPQRHTATERECLPRRIPDRPPPQSGDCTFSDYRRSGARVTFKLRCENGTTGEADLVWTADTYSGTTTMRGQGLENRVTLQGKRVGGDCDVNEQERRRHAEAAATDPDAARARDRERMCADAAESGDPVPFLPAEPGASPECEDATRFCAALETRRGLAQLRHAGLEDGARQAGALCKKDVAAVERRLCAALAKEPEKSVVADEATAEFVVASCPDLAAATARRSCAGRSYTGMPPGQRALCTRWAEEKLQGR